jgi:hypothetical protein
MRSEQRGGRRARGAACRDSSGTSDSEWHPGGTRVALERHARRRGPSRVRMPTPLGARRSEGRLNGSNEIDQGLRRSAVHFG